MPKEYNAMFPVQADSLEEAHRIVDGWDTGDSHVRMITGPPETWVEPPPPEPEAEQTAAQESLSNGGGERQL